MLYLTRRERFCAAHRLYRSEWDDKKNYEEFGPCSNKNWHGHNFILYVTIKGKINPTTGFVVNLKKLSPIIKRKVVDKIDHKNLNLEVDFMKDKIANWWMPDDIVFVNELPHTATGKIKKLELKKSFENYYTNHHKGSDES